MSWFLDCKLKLCQTTHKLVCNFSVVTGILYRLSCLLLVNGNLYSKTDSLTSLMCINLLSYGQYGKKQSHEWTFFFTYLNIDYFQPKHKNQKKTDWIPPQPISPGNGKVFLIWPRSMKTELFGKFAINCLLDVILRSKINFPTLPVLPCQSLTEKLYIFIGLS